MARILIADTPEDVICIERILGEEHELSVVSKISDAMFQFRENDFDLLMIGIHFDESRMFDLLRAIQTTPTETEKPIICFCTRDTQMTRTLHDSVSTTSRLLGAWMYLDEHEYSVTQDPDAEMRRVVERCLTDEARKKTLEDRQTIHRQRKELQRLRDALESEEWSEELEGRSVELRRQVAAALRELCDMRLDTVAQQDEVAASERLKDRVTDSVQSTEDEQTQAERDMWHHEIKQTAREVDSSQKEERKRIEGQHNRVDNNQN